MTRLVRRIAVVPPAGISNCLCDRSGDAVNYNIIIFTVNIYFDIKFIFYKNIDKQISTSLTPRFTQQTVSKSPFLDNRWQRRLRRQRLTSVASATKPVALAASDAFPGRFGASRMATTVWLMRFRFDFAHDNHPSPPDRPPLSTVFDPRAGLFGPVVA